MAKRLLPGDSAPWFKGQLVDGPLFNLDSIAGRPVLILVMGGAAWPGVPEALALIAEHRALFDDAQASFFGISIEQSDVEEKRIAPQRPGIRFYTDPDRSISDSFGAIRQENGQTRFTPHWLLLDRTLRVIRSAPLTEGREIIAALRDWLVQEDAPTAPVLIVPRVFEPAMCERLIGYYKETGGLESGFMSQEGAMTVAKYNYDHKRRSDCLVEDEYLQQQIGARLMRFLIPSIQRAFQFEATRIERYLVACYGSADGGGHFKPHRDNTTAGTAHRRFACTINLNADDYEGGDLRFPEFGRKTYRAPTGGAVVFSCSMMHEALAVTAGERYAFLPFLYDEAGAQLREANLQFLEPDKRHYRADRGKEPAAA